jgi:pSer/pThr/pTyr-binding forkhead associated (FHA) protein
MRETELTVRMATHVRRMERHDGPFSLLQVEGPGAGQSFLIDKNEMVIGRADDADVKVRSEGISRRHARLERKGADYVVRDNDSVNGILLNGVKVHSAVLRDGDVIQAGDAVFVYREG